MTRTAPGSWALPESITEATFQSRAPIGSDLRGHLRVPRGPAFRPPRSLSGPAACSDPTSEVTSGSGADLRSNLRGHLRVRRGPAFQPPRSLSGPAAYANQPPRSLSGPARTCVPTSEVTFGSGVDLRSDLPRTVPSPLTRRNPLDPRPADDGSATLARVGATSDPVAALWGIPGADSRRTLLAVLVQGEVTAAVRRLEGPRARIAFRREPYLEIPSGTNHLPDELFQAPTGR